MELQKYKARISHSEQEIIGYMIIVSDNNYLMAVTEKTMPGSNYLGTYSVDAKSVRPWPTQIDLQKREILTRSIIQLFDAHCNCYAVKDIPEIKEPDHWREAVSAMDRECFVQTVKIILSNLNRDVQCN